MPKAYDLTGKVFGRWTALERSENKKTGSARWACVCICGAHRILDAGSLLSGNSISCGCYRKENPNKKKHGACKTLVYQVWKAMIRRCENKKTKYYADYGGRGISVCERWQALAELVENQEDMLPEYVKVVDEHFWELGEEKKK